MTPRTLLGRTLLGACLVGATAMPPWLESRGEAAVADAWACGARSDGDGSDGDGSDGDGSDACGALGGVDLDVHGLAFADAWRDVGGFRIAMGRLSVTLEGGGLQIRAAGVSIARAEPKRAAAASESTASASARPSAQRRAVPSTHGLPVDIAIEDPVRVPGPDGSELTLEHARATLDGHGGLVVDAEVQVQHAALASSPKVRARATVQDGDLRRWRAEARVQLSPESDPLVVQATLDGPERELVAWARGGGAITVRPLGPRAVIVAARDFPIDTLASAWRGAALPEAIDLEHATVSGTIEAHLGEHPRLHLTDVELSGLVIDDARIAREPIDLDALRVGGDVGLHPGGGFADVVVARGDAEVGMSVALDADRIALSLELPEHECQALLDALPGAMRDTLGGMRMAGRIEGHVRLTIDRTALVSARGVYGGGPGEVPPQPGELDLSLPVLETCMVTADPAAIDLAALLGPYRHRFATASGDARARTLAPGAPGFAPLSTVQLLADAFVTLEDRRFFVHDGFDREQMENALWHNLLRGGVHRGASTISQQATRNLWLGVDRSLARKLQEALLTTRLEAEVPKERILELYLNVIELGPDVHGVEAAAQYWFGKPAAELGVREAVHLAALAPAPRRFALRFAAGEVDAEWDDMLDRQIRRMHLAGHITWAERDRGLRSRLRLVPHP